MKNYFISESTSRMEEGKTVIWEFSEINIKFPLQVMRVEKAVSIS